MVGRVTLKLPDGRTFGAGVKGGVEVNRFLLSQKDKLPGKMATIVYQNLTPDGIPRFPVFKALREDI
jgi:DNA ligase-1